MWYSALHNTMYYIDPNQWQKKVWTRESLIGGRGKNEVKKFFEPFPKIGMQLVKNGENYPVIA